MDYPSESFYQLELDPGTKIRITMIAKTYVTCISLLRLLQQNTAAWWLTEQKFISHSVGGWQIQDLGTGQFCFWWRFYSWLADSCFLSVSPHGLSSVHVHEERPSSSGKSTSPLRLGLHPYDLFNFNYLLNTLTLNIVTLGVKASASQSTASYFLGTRSYYKHLT